MAELVSQAEAARRFGVSRNAVNKLVKSGKLPLIQGKVHLESAVAVLAQKLDPEQSRILQNMMGAAQSEVDSGGAVDEGASENASPFRSAAVVDLASAKARKEYYQGLREQLAWERDCGNQVEVERVRMAAYKIGRMTRDSVLGVPRKIASAVRTCADQWEVEQVMTQALREALEDVAKMSDSDLERELSS